MLAPFALTLACALSAAPVGPSPEPRREGPARAGTEALSEASAAVRALVESAAALDAIPLEADGQLDVERVRRRLGGLQALAGSARPTLRTGPVADRLLADRILARAALRLVAELEAGRPPRAAHGVAAGAWREQLEATLRRARWTAAAHLRSCRDLAAGPTHAASRQVCADELARLGALLGASVAAEPPPGEAGVRAIRAARLPELQGCFDAWAAERPASAGPVEVTARLSLDAGGRVSAVALSPSGGQGAELSDCLADGLWLWVFPGLDEAEIELPLRIGAG